MSVTICLGEFTYVSTLFLTWLIGSFEYGVSESFLMCQHLMSLFRRCAWFRIANWCVPQFVGWFSRVHSLTKSFAPHKTPYVIHFKASNDWSIISGLSWFLDPELRLLPFWRFISFHWYERKWDKVVLVRKKHDRNKEWEMTRWIPKSKK